MKVIDRLKSSKVFERAQIERRNNEITVDMPPPGRDKNALPTTTAELLDMIDKDSG
jgi:hypothetical protein